MVSIFTTGKSMKGKNMKKYNSVKHLGRIALDFSKVDELIKNYKKTHIHHYLLKKEKHTLVDKSDASKEIDARIKAYRSQGYNNYNTRFNQVFDQEHPDVFAPFAKESGLEKAVCGIITQAPGNVLPMHRDTFINFKTKNRILADVEVVRYMIFLEDWVPGHMFTVENESMDNWKKGDIIYWGDAFHLGANASSVTKSTMNITGIANPDCLHLRL